MRQLAIACFTSMSTLYHKTISWASTMSRPALISGWGLSVLTKPRGLSLLLASAHDVLIPFSAQVEHGGDAEARNINGDTPLMFACGSGNLGTAALLLKVKRKGAHIWLWNSYQEFVLLFSVCENRPALCTNDASEERCSNFSIDLLVRDRNKDFL